MLPKDTDCCQSLGLKKDMPPVRGTYALCYAGELYSFQLDLPDTDSAQMILIRISEKPYSHLEWSNSAWRNEADNRSAVLRSQVFGISNAASTLYNMIEEISDEFPQLQDKSMVQIDIIKGNCCQMLREAVLLSEQAKYQVPEAIIRTPLFLDRELSNFVKSCQKVLGRNIRIQMETDSYLGIQVNRQRLIHALLCMIQFLKKKQSDMNLLQIQAQRQEECILLTIVASSNGVDAATPRHTAFQPMHTTPLLSPEEKILRMFGQTYGVVILSSSTEDRTTYTMRFPVCDEPADLSVETFWSNPDDHAFSLYEIMLSHISEYRFY